MLYFQKYKKNTLEYKFLNQIKNLINNEINIDCYFGFDFGFFSGINIYYGSKKDSKYASLLSDIFKNNNVNVRLTTNIDYDFDIIVLFSYVNNKISRKDFKKNKKIIMEALSYFKRKIIML